MLLSCMLLEVCNAACDSSCCWEMGMGGGGGVFSIDCYIWDLTMIMTKSSV